jgi:acetolactate synthase-1/2/3 large subunit
MIGLPEDVLIEPCTTPLVPAAAPARSAADPANMLAVGELLADAQRPVAIVGGSRWSDAAIAALPSALPGVPLVTGFRRQDLVDHRLDTCAGALGLGADPALVARVQAADLVIAIGDRLDDPTTNGFTLFEGNGSGSARRLVHVHPDPNEHGRVFPATIALATDPEAFLRALPAVKPRPERSSWTADARAGYLAWSRTDGLLDSIVRGLRELLPDDAIITNGAGNFTRPLHRSYGHRRPGRQLAPVSGSMGYGLPAAVAAKVTHPDRAVVCVAGDGDLMMTLQELATAAHEGLAIVVLVVDNRAYGTIRTHQERKFPGRPFATALTNPDFVELARSFGMDAERTTGSDDTIAALARALASQRAALVHLVTE